MDKDFVAFIVIFGLLNLSLFVIAIRSIFGKTDCHSRRVIFQNEHCEVVLIEWKPGEISELHDHGNSRGFIRVLSGQIYQDVYDKETKKSRMRTFHNPGDIILETPDIIHQMGNTSRDGRAATIHFYSPPLKMTDYQPEDLKVKCCECGGSGKLLLDVPSDGEQIECWRCGGSGKRINY